MKKFLSLVLALVMTMSLVTISAGATEYKDLTDKDEIQYEEAVAVLNRIGIITGYSDGSFQPKTELTRGAAAKIIVSLLIGTEAANNLVASAAPYTDVPVDHTFAGVISFCKTSKIIDGYQDGSFKPAGTLSGYAFAKMLLGALGYKSELEGFTGAGWTMNVARLGNAAGLFDRLSFKGNETVNREQACQLALNTLKATTVEYTGGLTVTAGDASVVGGQVRSYVTSNNRDFALNISARSVEDGWWTVEFGEEHFVDLRLEHDKRNPTDNDLGQPSAEWSYKKVTIGTYALEPDFRYTELVAHNDNSSTDASKVRALGLNGYEVDNSTQLWLNGYAAPARSITKVADIANYTDNGTVVEVYVSETNADLITDVVVIQSALVEVKRVGSDYVTLGKYDTDGADTHAPLQGYNREAFDVVNDCGLVASKAYNDVQTEDRGYDVLSGLKAGDKVVVVPVAEDHGNANFDIWEAYVPEEVTGALTRVDNYGSASSNRGTIGLTVAGTAYKAAEWNKDIIDIKGEDVKVTKKDVTLTLDKYGNALLAEDVGATKEYMVVGYYYQSLVDGRLVDFVHGWDVDGNEVDLNLGRNGELTTAKPGDLVQYVSNSTGTAEWKLNDSKTDGNPGKIFNVDYNANGGNYQITAYNTKVALTRRGDVEDNDEVDIANDSTTAANVKDFAGGVKFIYVEFNDDKTEVESVEIRKGVQATSNEELRTWKNGLLAANSTAYGSGEYNSAEAYVGGKDEKGDVAVKAVVIKRESNTAVSNNLLYIRDYLGSAQKSDSTGKIIYGYTVVMNTDDGLAGEAKTIYSYENLDVGDFASYSEVQNDQVSDFYKLREHNNRYSKTTTSFVAEVDYILASNDNIIVLKGDSYKAPDGSAIKEDGVERNPEVGTVVSNTGIATDKQTGEQVNRVRTTSRTQWVDLTPNHIASTKDLKDFKDIKLAMVVNDNVESDGFRDVSMIIVQEATRIGSGSSSGSGSDGRTKVDYLVRLNGRGQPIVEFTVTRPDWAATDAKGDVFATLFVDGVQIGADGSFNPTQLASGAVSTVSEVETNAYADRADDVEVRDITVAWDKVKVVSHEDSASGVTLSDVSAPVGASVTVSAKVKLATAGLKSVKVQFFQGEDQLGADQTFTSTSDLTALASGKAVSVSTVTVATGKPVTVKVTTTAKATNDVNITVGSTWVVKDGSTVPTSAVEGDTVSFVLVQKENPAADGAATGNLADNKKGFSAATGIVVGDVTVNLDKQAKAPVPEGDPTYSVLTIADKDFSSDGATKWAAAKLTAGVGTGVDAKWANKIFTKSGSTYTEVQTAPTTDESSTDYYHVTANGTAAKAAEKAEVTVSFTMPANAVTFTIEPSAAA